MPKRRQRFPQKSLLLALALDRSSSVTLQSQLFDQVRDAILSGRLAPGTRLPATRTLATELSVSRNTVLAAFERLYSEGYTEGQVGSGTRVSHVLPEELLSARHASQPVHNQAQQAGKLSDLSQSLARQTSLSLMGLRHGNSPSARQAFRPNTPDLNSFPFPVWSRIIGRFWRNPPKNLMFSGDLAGYRPLRDAIAAYLGAARGVICSGENIVITSGAQQALDLISRTVIDPGDEVWVENPGYSGLRNTLAAAGGTIVHIPIDNQGLSVQSGIKHSPNAVLAAVTPSHQYPLGITMSLSRRLELLDWAQARSAWILEDDYDSDFRYSGKPISALQGLDKNGSVIYVGTFSKVLFPTLRLGYAVLPDSLLEPFLKIRSAIDDHPALALQPALSEFIEEGHFAAHVRRLRKLYGERQQILIRALEDHGAGLLTAQPHEAGMHLIANLSDQASMTDQQASHRADQAGIRTPPLSQYYVDPSKDRRGLVLGYAGFTAREINRGVSTLVSALSGNTQ